MRIAAAAVTALLLAGLAHGYYIERLYPLKDVIKESEVIAVGEIEKFDLKRRTCVAKITGTLKGRCDFEQIRMNIGVGQMWHPEAIVKHLTPKSPFLIFYNAERKAIGYVHHFFFQLYGDAAAEPAKAWWNFTHIEIFMNRTFDGTPGELATVVKGMLEGKPAHAADPKKRPLTKEMIDALKPPGADGDVGPGFESLPPPPKPKVRDYAPDEEGFLRNWLWLEPVLVSNPAGVENADAQKRWFDREWFAGQKTATPKADESIKVRMTDFTWVLVPSDAAHVDLAAFSANQGRSAESALFLGYVYIFCAEEIKGVYLSIGSDDASAWRLNGEEVIRSHESRGLDRDQNKSAAVTLKKGMNVLAVVVINVGGPTGACARFLREDGTPVRGFRHSPEPKEPPSEY